MPNLKSFKDVYIPHNPEYKILEAVSGSARVLQSYAKVPFMVSFKIQDSSGQTSIKQLIFKFGDDCRQDMLALDQYSNKLIWIYFFIHLGSWPLILDVES